MRDYPSVVLSVTHSHKPRITLRLCVSNFTPPRQETSYSLVETRGTSYAGTFMGDKSLVTLDNRHDFGHHQIIIL